MPLAQIFKNSVCTFNIIIEHQFFCNIRIAIIEINSNNMG